MSDYKNLYMDMPAPRFQARRDDARQMQLFNPNKMAAAFFGGLEDASDILVPLRDLFSEGDYAEFKKCYDVCLSAQASVHIELQPLASLPSGAARSMRSFTMFPVVDSKGRAQGVDVIGNAGIVRSSPAQEGQNDELLLMSAVFDLSEVGIVVTDDAHKVVRVNQSIVKNFGWNEAELMGRGITSFITADARKAFASQMVAGVDAPRGSGELRVIRSDGSIANVLFTAAAMELSGGRVFQVYTLMDITLRKRMEETLRAAKERADSASRAKSVFLANMSHELRTPLNAIMGFSEIMIEGTFGKLVNERYTGYIDDIHSSASHLLGIINEVLDMSKIESGKVELDEEWESLGEIIISVVRMMESRAFGKSISFACDLSLDLPEVFCDKRIFRQVFINLLMNAVKFSGEGDVIRIHASMRESGRLCVHVIDQGTGIPEDKIEQVLEPFGQVDDSNEYLPQEGTGLGLPIAKAMVEMHDGELDLKSVLGQGTEVLVFLPSSRLRV